MANQTGEAAAATNELYKASDLTPLLQRLQIQEWKDVEVDGRGATDRLTEVIDPLDGQVYVVRFAEQYACLVECPEILPTFSRLTDRGRQASPLVSFQRMRRVWGPDYRYALFPQVDRSSFVYTTPGDVRIMALSPWSGYGVGNDVSEREQQWFRSTLERLLAT